MFELANLQFYLYFTYLPLENKMRYDTIQGYWSETQKKYI